MSWFASTVVLNSIFSMYVGTGMTSAMLGYNPFTRSNRNGTNCIRCGRSVDCPTYDDLCVNGFLCDF